MSYQCLIFLPFPTNHLIHGTTNCQTLKILLQREVLELQKLLWIIILPLYLALRVLVHRSGLSNIKPQTTLSRKATFMSFIFLMPIPSLLTDRPHPSKLQQELSPPLLCVSPNELSANLIQNFTNTFGEPGGLHHVNGQGGQNIFTESTLPAREI